MIEAYKIVMRESASVRRAEELARRFKHQSGQKPRATDGQPLIVSESIDRMQDDIQRSLGALSNVKLKRSLRQTKLYIVLKGSPEITDDILARIHSAITSSSSPTTT